MAEDRFERIFIRQRDLNADSYFLYLKVPLGLENFRDSMTGLFTEEREKLNLLFDYMTGVYTAIKLFEELTGREI